MSVASRNLFAALGSDDEEESRPAIKSTTSKPAAKSEPKKSTEAPAAPAATAPRGGRGGAGRGGRGGGGGERRGSGRGGRGRGGAGRGGYSNDDAYNDREEVMQNREREPGVAGRGSGRSARPRGGREFDRHSQTGRVYLPPHKSGPKYTVKCIRLICRDTQKATNQGWGDETTAWESAEPIAEADRNEEKKDADATTTTPAPAPKATEEPAAPAEPEKEPEPEDHTLTYTEWLAAKATDKSDFAAQPIRQTDQSKWAHTQSVISKKDRAVDDGLFGEATTGAQKSRSVSTSAKKAPKKVIIEIEQRFTPLRSDRRGGDRGGRGGERSSRGVGEGRAGRGGEDRDRPSVPRGERGRGRADGERGYAGRGGGRGGRVVGRPSGPTTVDVHDKAAFPALG